MKWRLNWLHLEPEVSHFLWRMSHSVCPVLLNSQWFKCSSIFIVVSSYCSGTGLVDVVNRTKGFCVCSVCSCCWQECSNLDLFFWESLENKCPFVIQPNLDGGAAICCPHSDFIFFLMVFYCWAADLDCPAGKCTGQMITNKNTNKTMTYFTSKKQKFYRKESHYYHKVLYHLRQP